VSWYL